MFTIEKMVVIVAHLYVHVEILKQM